MTESQPAAGSNVWMEARTVFASLPDLPPPVLAVMYESVGFQYDCNGRGGQMRPVV